MSVDGVSHIAQAIPILRVADLAASLHYYTNALGFSLQWRAGEFCIGWARQMLTDAD